MTRGQAIDILCSHEAELRAAGVGALFLFGSVARNEADAQSDVDVFFDPERNEGFTLFDLERLRERMAELLHSKVDIMSRNGIHPRRKPAIEAQAVRVF